MRTTSFPSAPICARCAEPLQQSQIAIGLFSGGVVRTIPREEYRDLVAGMAPIDAVLDLFGRPKQIHSRAPASQRLGPDYAEVLGSLALSDRPLRPVDLPSVTANPSKVAERLRRKLGAPWIVTGGRGEGKTFEFAVPPGLSIVVIADSRASIDFNALAWL